MKKEFLSVSLCLFLISFSFAQDKGRKESSRPLSEPELSTLESPVLLNGDKLLYEEENVVIPESICAEWAAAKMAVFIDDESMCDVGTALFEDEMRKEAMKEHPDWPIWAIDIALSEAREKYLRNMLFSK